MIHRLHKTSTDEFPHSRHRDTDVTTDTNEADAPLSDETTREPLRSAQQVSDLDDSQGDALRAPRAGTSAGLCLLGEARPARAGPGSQDATDQPGSSSTQPVTAVSRLPRRSIVPLAATASRALPAVASHAIGFADP